MSSIPTSPEARAVQALNDGEASLRTMSSATLSVSAGVEAAVDRLEAAVDALRTVSASNAVVVASIDAAANALVRAATALEEVREDRL